MSTEVQVQQTMKEEAETMSYYDAVWCLRGYKGELKKEEARIQQKMQTKLQNKLAMIKLRRRAVERRRILLESDVETYKVKAEFARRQASETPMSEEDIDRWTGNNAMVWAEATYKIPSKDVHEFVTKIDEYLPLTADPAKSKEKFWDLIRLGAELLMPSEPEQQTQN